MSGDDLPSAGFCYICLGWLYDQLYIFDNLRYPAKEKTFERRHRARSGGLPHFVGWNAVEYYAI